VEAVSAEATRAHPIEVRYSNDDHTCWTLYSRHRSKKAADRAFAEACREMPEAWVQLRNDIEKVGLLEQRWMPRKWTP
jgi:hypothetical protein